MTQDGLKQAIAAAQQRLESLLHRATGDNCAALLREAIAAVSHNLEQLQVLAEELEAQNDELTATRKAVEAERQRYQDLFKNTPDGYLVTDGTGIIQQANRAAAQLLNTELSYLVGKPLVVFVHPQQRGKFRQILTQLKQQQQIRGEELRMFHPIRKIDFPAQLTGAAMWDTQGKLQSLCFLLRDISDRKQAEDQLEKMSTALSHAVEGISFLDTQGRYVTINQAYANMVGYSPAEMIGMLWHPTVHPEDLETMNAAYQQMLTSGKVEAEARGIRKDGSMFYKQIVMVAAYDNQKQLIGHYCFMKDISDRKQAQIELQKAKEAAEAANVAKSTFLANMSHELRTPLNAILGFTQMMGRDTSLSAKQQEQVKIINNSGDHLLALINDILEMSKIEAGRSSFNPSSFDLINFLSTLEELFKLKAESKGLQLKFELAPDLPQYIQTDEGKLRQILINLVGNALKFTEKGQVSLRIIQENPQTITNHQLPITNYQLIFEIEDTGFGIKPEEIDRIFDPFIQSESGKKVIQGTGLGLAISRKFVQMMGGDIRVNSKPNQGSLFTFDIQVAPAEAIAQNTNPTPRQVIGLAPGQPEYRILVVEDHPESRLLLTTLLSSIGFQVSQASNGQEAIDIWSTWKPHLICMDMRMPVIDGIEATQQIRAREKELIIGNSEDQKIAPSAITNNPTIIIAITANAFESDQKFALAAGCNDYISKPFQQDIVWQKIGQYLEIVYLYESENQPTDKLNQNLESKITTEEIKTLLDKMPVDWLSTLHKNAYIGDDNIIFELLEKIPPEDAPLAKALADLTHNFEFDKIIELTQT